MGFNLADYQPVEERNAQFWAKYPEGRLLTEMVFDDGQRCVFRCEAYKNSEDARPAATGHAEEHVTTRGVNSTSALENCETSAEGRALARLGFAPKGARPSREEMEKAQRRQPREESAPQQRQAEPTPTAGSAEAARKQLETCAENSWDLGVVAARYQSQYGETLREATDANRVAAFTKLLFAVSDTELKSATNGVPA
jgi:hypothetical protein